MGVLCHFDVGIDAVAHHGNLFGLKMLLSQDADEHVGVGFAQCDVGTTACGMFQTLADGTAVDEDGPFVGGQTRSGLVAM